MESISALTRKLVKCPENYPPSVSHDLRLIKSLAQTNNLWTIIALTVNANIPIDLYREVKIRAICKGTTNLTELTIILFRGVLKQISR